ncbi:hypothetical protein SODALDRAFT_357824 [Sodiomyces alkalinus F11]|uniref:Phospholipid metabolism enzyme regulator n=1 Tax=Sodiomyces alkalinus (strain CBS 110278 / VKM F-3762 / F11) TaxID=1314773 RepID=A0A3N2Q4Q4_SODAK|nr:hypothetical protein SODALDRAFT_357824 [Sodiomyces alkalinus F11]ROT41741.1 hypothetical protein SODALDRAFT_357824 [Sodiomyces alkalinus F11]
MGDEQSNARGPNRPGDSMILGDWLSTATCLWAEKYFRPPTRPVYHAVLQFPVRPLVVTAAVPFNPSRYQWGKSDWTGLWGTVGAGVSRCVAHWNPFFVFPPSSSRTQDDDIIHHHRHNLHHFDSQTPPPLLPLSFQELLLSANNGYGNHLTSTPVVPYDYVYASLTPLTAHISRQKVTKSCGHPPAHASSLSPITSPPPHVPGSRRPKPPRSTATNAGAPNIARNSSVGGQSCRSDLKPSFHHLVFRSFRRIVQVEKLRPSLCCYCLFRFSPATMDRSTNSSTGSLNADPQESSGLPDASRVPSSSTLRSRYSKDSSNSNSLNRSPLPSRDPSPSRLQPWSSATANTSRSRRNSQNDTSPTRTPKPTISAPPLGSRTLSPATTPTLLPVSQDSRNRPAAAPQKASDHGRARENPRWPVSPRLRSPPPQLNRPVVASLRRNETDPPGISLQRPTPSIDNAPTMSESETEDSQTHSGVRTPAVANSSTLETVQEVSQPNSPGPLDADLEKINEKLADEALTMPAYPVLAENKNHLRLARGTESGIDSASTRADSRRSRSSAPPPTTSRQSSAVSAKQGKNKPPGDGPAQTMIVETETVTSIPQMALGPGSKMENGGTGTLRAKPSTETIKPKKEKKKNSRKQPAVPAGTGETPHLLSNVVQYKLRHHQSMRSVSVATDVSVSPTKSLQDEAISPHGRLPNVVSSYHISSLLTKPRPASSKADIFEAKVASAVDEADSSDSEETFVYDSNPPDGGDRPRRFHHSRTPSAASMASQVDRSAMRSIHAVMESGANQAPPLRKGMKFVNTFAGGEAPMIGEEDGDGSARSTTGPGSGRGTTRRHHNHTHIGRWGRNGANSHTSLFDNESPFPNAARSKLSGNQSRHSSNPPSPRMTHQTSSTRGGISSAKRSLMPGQSYDLDDTTGADDERTPLISPTVRRGRNRRNYVDLRHLECQTYRQKPSYLNRFAACLVVTMMLLLVITGAIGFMFATSQPLTDIELVSIKNVVASDPELMFDIAVKAHNPNIVVIAVDQANIEVFAKSPRAGTDMDWWKSPHGPNDHDGTDSDIHIEDDPPYEPPDDEAAPNMHLGTITEFDSPLSFEGSFFNKGVSTSTGGMRLSLPGNHSAGGSERWGRIIQDDFVLVLKGVVRYTLPLSQRVRSASITGRTTVKPNSASNPSLNTTLPWNGSDPNRGVLRQNFSTLGAFGARMGWADDEALHELQIPEEKRRGNIRNHTTYQMFQVAKLGSNRQRGIVFIRGMATDGQKWQLQCNCNDL